MNTPLRKTHVLFLCTGNSCRSQMAEGWAKHLARISHDPSTADADLLAVTGRTPSSRFDVVSTMPAPSSGPCTPSQRHLDALATNGGEKCGLGAGRIEVRSAGIEAHGKNPRAIAVMAEAGVEISHQESTRLSEDMLDWADLVVTVCGHADDHCPTLPPVTRKQHWPLEDPAKASGTEDEITAVFRVARDEIKRRVTALLDELFT